MPRRRPQQPEIRVDANCSHVRVHIEVKLGQWRFESALPGWVTVKVGPERPSSARFSLANQAQIGMAVDCLLEALTTQADVGSQSSANGV